jgi:hypothetical protein
MMWGHPQRGKILLYQLNSGRKTMKVGKRPGVTRDKQWVRLGTSGFA